MQLAYIPLASVHTLFRQDLRGLLVLCVLSTDEPQTCQWLSSKHWQEYVDVLFDRLYDEAYAAAAEQDSPNSHDFARIVTMEQEKRGIFM